VSLSVNARARFHENTTHAGRARLADSQVDSGNEPERDGLNCCATIATTRAPDLRDAVVHAKSPWCNRSEAFPNDRGGRVSRGQQAGESGQRYRRTFVSDALVRGASRAVRFSSSRLRRDRRARRTRLHGKPASASRWLCNESQIPEPVDSPDVFRPWNPGLRVGEKRAGHPALARRKMT